MKRKYNAFKVAAVELVLWSIAIIFLNHRDGFAIFLIPFVGIVTFALAYLAYNHRIKSKNLQLICSIFFVAWLIILNAWTIRQFFWYR